MVASSRLAGMRSPGRKSPACTSERSWSRSWTYSGTWLSGWRCSGNIVSHLEPILHDIGLPQEPICLPPFWRVFEPFLSGARNGEPAHRASPHTEACEWLRKAAAELPHSKWLVGGWLVAKAAIFFAGSEVADAELRQIFFVALENFHHRQVFILDLVLPCLHVFGVIVGSADDRAAGMGSNAELPGRGLVIGIAEAVPDASTVDDVADEGDARVWRRPDRGDHSGSERQSANNLLGTGFHAVQVECVR